MKGFLKSRYTIVFLLMALALFVLPACALNAAPSASGANLLASTDLTAAETVEEEEISLEDVPDGAVIRLSYMLSESVRIELVGTNKVVTVDRGRWTPFAQDRIFWVRANGDVMDLLTAIRRSNPEPIEGTVFVTTKDGNKILEVYKDASLIPTP